MKILETVRHSVIRPATLALVASLVMPAVATAQDKAPAPPATDKSTTGGTQAGGTQTQSDQTKNNRPRRRARNRSQSAPGNGTLYVVPAAQGQGGTPAAGQAAKLGPDGKPMPPGPGSLPQPPGLGAGTGTPGQNGAAPDQGSIFN